MAKVLRTVDAHFCTLTYPGEWFPEQGDQERYKNDLDKLRRRFMRAFPALAAHWKLEFQTGRGAPHYHLIVWGQVDSVPKMRNWFAINWHECATEGIELSDKGRSDHLKAGVQFDPCKSRQGQRAYMRKYGSKRDQTLEGVYTGHYWGRINREQLKVFQAKEQILEIPLEDAKRMRRILRKRRESLCNQASWRHFLVWLQDAQVDQTLKAELWRRGGTLDKEFFAQFAVSRVEFERRLSFAPGSGERDWAEWYLRIWKRLGNKAPGSYQLRNYGAEKAYLDVNAFLESWIRYGESPSFPGKDHGRQVRIQNARLRLEKHGLYPF